MQNEETTFFSIPDTNYEINTLGIIRHKEKKNIISQFISTSGYWSVTLYKNNKKKNYKVHKLLANVFLNANNQMIDHINRNRLDNRLKNLRLTNQHENTHNCVISNSNSGSRGIHILKNGKYRSTITINYRVYQKTFDTIEKAIMYRVLKKIENSIKF